MNIRRGLFRLWLVGSSLWAVAIGLITLNTWPHDVCVDPLAWSRAQPIDPCIAASSPSGFDPSPPQLDRNGLPQFDPNRPYIVEKASERRNVVVNASIVALVPPATFLIIGSALLWAFRGFRSDHK